jgi:hypothetical protein
MGLEPMTSSLPRKCSTAELHRLIKFTVSECQLITNCKRISADCQLDFYERKTRFELATYSLEGYRSTN